MKQDASSPPQFDDAFRARLLELFCWRRDVRRFRTEPLPPACWSGLSRSPVWPLRSG